MNEPGPVPAVRTTGLQRGFRTKWALKDCSLAVPSGSVSALVGANGAGKTTLMRVLAGLDRPTAGEAEVLGKPAIRRFPHPEVAYLDQHRPLYDGFTVSETLRVGAELNPSRWDADYARGLVEQAGLSMRTKVRRLSGGQRALLALAVALGPRPRLALLDEPLAGVDPVARQRILRTLMTEVAETGMTVVLSTHELADIDGIADHLLLLSEGAPVLAGDIEELLAEHRVIVGSAESLSAMRDPLGAHTVITSSVTGRQTTTFVRLNGAEPADDRHAQVPGVSELVLAYLDQSSDHHEQRPKGATA